MDIASSVVGIVAEFFGIKTVQRNVLTIRMNFDGRYYFIRQIKCLWFWK